MKLIHQSCTPLVQESGLDGVYKQIELAGRTCYKSTDRITAESAKPFVDRMIKSNHTAMLEHGTVYLKFPDEDTAKEHDWVKYHENPYSRISLMPSGEFAITTNLRVITEHHWENDLQFICEPTEYHEKRYTLCCTTALHCYKDLTRHRTMSFAIESTRYCNYLKEKFGKGLVFINPTWMPKATKIQKWLFKSYLWITEKIYLQLVKRGWQAQQAAEVLPQCVKGDMVITGFASDWEHLMDLRYYGTTGAPHPMVKELATLMKVQLEKLGFNYER